MSFYAGYSGSSVSNRQVICGYYKQKPVHRRVYEVEINSTSGSFDSKLDYSKIDKILKMEGISMCSLGATPTYADASVNGTQDYFRVWLGPDGLFQYRCGTGAPPVPFTLIYTIEWTNKTT